MLSSAGTRLTTTRSMMEAQRITLCCGGCWIRRLYEEFKKLCLLSRPFWPTMGDRFSALLWRQHLMASIAADSTSPGYLIVWFGLTMAWSFWMKWSSAKGVLPYTIWYRMQPRDQMSDGCGRVSDQSKNRFAHDCTQSIAELHEAQW
uniref:Uncharacterized protein n=1 Tax=Craspedostauros australis TaxID=1486917 RepID=A0A7R9ZQU7_9STRA|mmetsp:Transcript_63/g.162  ORF Transcript_63/g.162 Transcript_63/m.162 type:complete len:147 (+) Transcript_63:85-525(+)